jgi:hypothetical protein
MEPGPENRAVTDDVALPSAAQGTDTHLFELGVLAETTDEGDFGEIQSRAGGGESLEGQHVLVLGIYKSTEYGMDTAGVR